MSRELDPVLTDPELSAMITGYRLERLIGRGALAVVYLARSERPDRQVALKILEPELARDAAFRARFVRESRAAAALGHPHIVPVYEAGEQNGLVYAAMRYVPGGDARSLLNQLGPLPFGRAWSIVAQVASALDAAHGRGLIHRDVQPANMLLEAGRAAGYAGPDPAGGSDVDHVFLTGFGTAGSTPPGEAHAAGQFAGMLDYLAPEQIEGRAVDGRADLYSLACAGFELLCGTPPFGQDQGLTVLYAQLYAPPPTASSRRPELPAAVDRVLATALAKHPADRHATCGQFAQELREALGLPAGEPDPRRPGAQGPAGPAVAARLAAGRDGPAAEDEPVLQPARAAPEPARAAPEAARAAPEPGQFLAPATPAHSWPRTPEGPSPAGPGRTSADTMGAPAAPDPERRRPHGGRRLILAVAAVVIIAAVAVGIALAERPAPRAPAAASPVRSSAPASSPSSPLPSSPPPSPSSPPSSSSPSLASRQAAAVNSLLGSSEAARTALQDPVVEVGQCANLSGAAAQIQGVVNQRSAELSQASTLSAAALPDGAVVKSSLIAALRSSLDSDEDYLTWAQQQLSSGCAPAAQSSAYSAAIAAGQQADAAKDAFAGAWNPVAARYGIQQVSPSSL